MVSTTVDEETGEEKKRLINRMRWKGYGPASIMFTDPMVHSEYYYSVHYLMSDRFLKSLLLMSRKYEIMWTSNYLKRFRRYI
jgi:hypothetical protein